jgi:hypothetical protein
MIQHFSWWPFKSFTCDKNKCLYRMNQKWWNNKIHYFLWEIKLRCSSASKNTVEMLSEYLQKLNIKRIFMILKFFYLHFCLGSVICEWISRFKSCGVVPWCGSHKNILTTHSPNILLLSHFIKTLPFPPYFVCVRLWQTTFYERCSSPLTCTTVAMYLSWAWKSLYEISLP